MLNRFRAVAADGRRSKQGRGEVWIVKIETVQGRVTSVASLVKGN